VTYWEGVVLGVVQGLTEFLPISSSGHLVLAESLLGLETPGVVVEVVLHVATLLAVVLVYRRRLGELVVGVFAGNRSAWRVILLLGVATVPAAIVGVLFSDFFERTFESLLVVGVSFIVTGLVLWSTKWVSKGGRTTQPGLSGAATIGLAQAMAIFPGISRSGSTVATAMWLGIEPVRAAEFSFILAIPAIAGAAVLQIPDLADGVGGVGAGPLAVSFVASLIAGIAAIKLLIALLRSQAFHFFAPYLWGLGALTTAWALIR
jgi:undecaprenyl-diphosphatase